MVTWDMVPAMDQNGIVTIYEVQYEPLETFGGQIQTMAAIVTAPERTELLVLLQEFVNYTISVRAYTVQGEGPFSVGVTVMTREDGKSAVCMV